MGAWGEDSFDNDLACDWAYTLEECEDLSVVESTLKAAVEAGEDGLDADVASEALAACEVVARLKGNFGARNGSTETVDEWVKAHPQKPSPKIVGLALKAIECVLGEDSELRALWREAGEEKWLAAVHALRDRVK